MRSDIMKLIIYLLIGLVFSAIILLMILLGFPPAHNGSGNLTQTSEEPATVGHDQVKMLIISALIIGLVGALVAYAMERGKERCPACGEVLRLVHEVQKYKCLHCGSWYPREDIEVEVVE